MSWSDESQEASQYSSNEKQMNKKPGVRESDVLIAIYDNVQNFGR